MENRGKKEGEEEERKEGGRRKGGWRKKKGYEPPQKANLGSATEDRLGYASMINCKRYISHWQAVDSGIPDQAHYDPNFLAVSGFKKKTRKLLFYDS